MGGSADLNPSTFTYLDISKDFQKGHYAERNIRFGVREHGMLAIVIGLSAHGGVIPYAQHSLTSLVMLWVRSQLVLFLTITLFW